MGITEGCVPQLVLEGKGRRQGVDDEWENERADDVSPYRRRKSAGIWVAVATLAIALAFVAGYGYSVLSDQDSLLSQIPGMTSSLPAINEHLSSLEKRLDEWRNSQQALASHVGQMDAGWKLALGTAKQQTAALIAETQINLRREMVAQTQAISAQLLQVESNERTYQARLMHVEAQLAEAREQVSTLRRDYSQEVAALQSQQAEAQREIATLNSALATRQVAFEVQKDQPQEIVPGMSLHLTNTDVRFQRFDGWIEPSPNGEKLWVRGQGIEQPFVFYPNQQDEAYELVVTSVSDKGASGFLLVPAAGSAIDQAGLDDGKSSTPVTLFPASQSRITDP